MTLKTSGSDAYSIEIVYKPLRKRELKLREHLGERLN